MGPVRGGTAPADVLRQVPRVVRRGGSGGSGGAGAVAVAFVAAVAIPHALLGDQRLVPDTNRQK